ncbi:MAG: hypothetical protein KKF62_06905 [Bacteroidetes bacterium]|nr:hypothetical protein [Bacteroidota bacterium]MBU1116248.1 hypothetical protein [Bacteroidota bacterium]MBU1799960.1 hypothetical protein [Bacteroidota bacterium]
MNKTSNNIKYQSAKSDNFADEIIIGTNSILSKNLQNFSNIDLTARQTQIGNEFLEKYSNNYLFNFSVVIIGLMAAVILLTKIVTISFSIVNNFSTGVFIFGYIFIFISTVILITKRKMLSLKIKDETLYIKSFPALNKKISVSQILKCELNTIDNGHFNSKGKIHFAINENGNRYKQPLTAGITLQLIDGNNIIIGSVKS